jgi:hypothetical protein
MCYAHPIKEGGSYGIEHEKDRINTKEEKDVPRQEEKKSYVQDVHPGLSYPYGEEWVTRFDMK